MLFDRRTVPSGGEYWYVPRRITEVPLSVKEAVASNWVGPKREPALTPAGLAQAMVGVACCTLIVTVSKALV